MIGTKHLIRFVENKESLGYRVRNYSNTEEAEYTYEIVARLRERDKLIEGIKKMISNCHDLSNRVDK